MDLNQKRFIIGDSMKTLSEHNDSEILNLMVVNTKEMSMIVSVGSNNVIQVHEDDKLNETAVRRTINIPNYKIQIAKVYQYKDLKFLIVGLNKGYIKTYELETGRPDASYPGHKEGSDIVEIHPL
jgi:WD40 repeat protein